MSVMLTVPTVKTYTRVVSTADGGTAFEDAVLDLTEQPVSAGVPAMSVAGLDGVRGVLFLQFAGFDSTPHPASEPQWVVMLRGVIEVVVSDGSVRQFGPGDLVLATDVAGRGHVTQTVGSGPFEALIIPAAPTA